MTRACGTSNQETKNASSKKSLNSRAMTRANQLKKEGYSLSEALKQAWAELQADRVKATTTVEVVKEMGSMTLSEQVQEYKELEKQINALKERMDEIKTAITTVMEAKSIQQLDVDIFKIRYQEIISNKFDTKIFKETYTELYKQFLYESRCKRFTIAC